MIQPIDLRLNDSKTQNYFSQMRQQQNNKNANNLQMQIETQIMQEVEKEIEQISEKIDSETEAKNTEQQQNKAGISGLNENLNKVANMNSVFFQFEFIEPETDIKAEERKKELILKVIDKETKEVLSQYPTEISVKIAQMLDQLIGRGQLTDVKA